MDLILSTYGTTLTRENNCFVIFFAGEKQQIAAHDIQSIQISLGISMSSDAVFLAIEHGISIFFLARNGAPKGLVWSSRYGSISTIRKGQLKFCDSRHATRWIQTELQQKISNQQALILSLHRRTKVLPQKVIDKAVERLEDYKAKINGLEGDLSQVAASLRGHEGSASRIYFEAICRMLPEHYQFDTRSQHPAHDVTNALLNYGYGILYSRIENALIKAGLDPYIGILHRDEYNHPVLVYDVIERFRIWVDDVVCQILLAFDINDDCFSLGDDGTCWLEAQGRRILINCLNDYLDENVVNKNISRSRLTHIQYFANELANTFNNYYKTEQKQS